MKKSILILFIILSGILNAQDVYNWQFVPDGDHWAVQYDINSNNTFTNAISVYPIKKILLNADTLICNSWSIKPSDLSNWNNKLSGSYNPTLSVSGRTLTAGGNSITIPSQSLSISGNTLSLSSDGSIVLPTSTSQTLTGSNGITINSGVNTFTISKSRRQETYSGTTNSSGVYSVTFSQAYSVAPNIQANIVGGSSNQVVTMTVTTTGFTCTVVQRNAVTLLSVEVLLASTVNVNNASVDVLITEK